MTTKQVPAQ